MTMGLSWQPAHGNRYLSDVTSDVASAFPFYIVNGAQSAEKPLTGVHLAECPKRMVCVMLLARFDEIVNEALLGIFLEAVQETCH